MSTEKEGKMWFLHCQLLTDIMVQILKEKEDLHKESEKRTFLKCIKNKLTMRYKESEKRNFLNGIIWKLTARYDDMIGDRESIVGSQNDAEYTFYKNHTNPKDDGGLNHKKEMFSIIDGLSGPAYRAADVLTRIGFERKEKKIEETENTALWSVFEIGYLNRKFCLGAEGVVNKKGNWYKKMKEDEEKKKEEGKEPEKVSEILYPKSNDTNKDKDKDKDSNAMRLFLNCLRPRLNYIGGDPWRKYLFKKNSSGKKEIDDYSVTDLVELFERFSKDETLDVPFSKQIHRLRGGFPGNNPLDAHLLGIDAGAHSNAITQESTLGKIRQSLELPLRCDISGTTVDAMGFCDTFIEKNQENSNKEERMAYLVSCMLSMCLTGHHSLDEMALALSLDVEVEKYDPCNPASVIGLLREWSGWHDFEFSNDKYYKSKAKGIINIKCLETLEFTRKLWDDLATHNKIMKGWKYDNDKDKLEPPEKEK